MRGADAGFFSSTAKQAQKVVSQESRFLRGRVSERPKEAVSKTVRRRKAPRGFKSLPFRHFFLLEESRSWPSAHDWKSCHPNG